MSRKSLSDSKDPRPFGLSNINQPSFYLLYPCPFSNLTSSPILHSKSLSLKLTISIAHYLLYPCPFSNLTSSPILHSKSLSLKLTISIAHYLLYPCPFSNLTSSPILHSKSLSLKLTTPIAHYLLHFHLYSTSPQDSISIFIPFSFLFHHNNNFHFFSLLQFSTCR